MLPWPCRVRVITHLSQSQLERDVATIARWGAKALVTLLEPVELAALHVDKLSSLAAAAKLAWYHLPLSIGMLPDAQFERLWSSASSRLQQIVRLRRRCFDRQVSREHRLLPSHSGAIRC